MASVIKVDQIQSDTGQVNLSSNISFTGTQTINSPRIGGNILNSSGNPILRQSGSILQVANSTVINNTTSTTSAYTSPAEISNSSTRLTFTPINSNSKLLVTLCSDIKWDLGALGCMMTVKRDGVNLATGFSSNQYGLIFGYQSDSNSWNHHNTYSVTIMIDASSTSASVFSVWMGRYGGSGTANCGDWAPTTLTIMEISV